MSGFPGSWSNLLVGIQFLNEETHTVGIYLFKAKNGNTRIMCAIFPKLAIKAPKRCHTHCSGTFIYNFEKTSHLALVFQLFTLIRKCRLGRISIFKVNKFEVCPSFAKKLSVEILVFVQIPSHFRLRNVFLLLHHDKSTCTETPIENRVKGGIVWKYYQF